MTQVGDARAKQAFLLRLEGKTYSSIGSSLNVSRSRAQQMARVGARNIIYRQKEHPMRQQAVNFIKAQNA